MSYLDNDDDLFEYDPDLEIQHNSKEDLSTQSSPFDSLFGDKSNNESDSSASFLERFDVNKIHLASSFHKSTHSYFSKIEQPSYYTALSITLDKITNGEFSMIHMFYRKQNLITSRLNFLSMMNVVLERSSSDSEQEQSYAMTGLNQLLKQLGLDLDDRHIDIFYVTSVSICRHLLTLDRVMYQELSRKLNIPVKPELIDPEYLPNPSNINNPILVDYFDQAISGITKALSSDGLLERLQEAYGTQVTLANEN